MPIYELYCTKCSEVREILVPIKDRKQKIECPICKKEMKRYVNKVHLSSKRATYGY